MQQMMLIGTKHDPHATERMDIAIADFIFSNGLPISLLSQVSKVIPVCKAHSSKIYSSLQEKNGRTIAGGYLSINIR
jgi:hypothetical protein